MRTFFARVRTKGTEEKFQTRQVSANGKKEARLKLEQMGLEVENNKVKANTNF
jgi:hypothetical protein